MLKGAEKATGGPEQIPSLVVIDDEVAICEGCRQILEEEGWNVGVAHNGESGLQLVKEMSPDVVLVDLKMPGMYGMEVLQKILEIDPLISPIVISGYGTIDTAVEALKKGADDFVCKPFDEKTLTSTLEAGLKCRRRKHGSRC